MALFYFIPDLSQHSLGIFKYVQDSRVMDPRIHCLGPSLGPLLSYVPTSIKGFDGPLILKALAAR